MTGILTRYQSFKKRGLLTLGIVQEKLPSEHRDVYNADELTGIIHRQLKEENMNMLDATALDQLEHDLDTALQHIKMRKTQLKMEMVKALQDKNMQLKNENDSMIQAINAARINDKSDDSSDAEQPQLPVRVIW
uniref:MADS-box transcription factor 18-like n=1 Tax=Erigeron canadensis TaxID=72917 RepID=UPI001CB90535|nr:MADS-box transcription factor 18-like [Erigeron canadensis]